MATAKRNTWQKQVIYSVMKELTSHPTASELYDELVKRGYDIGKSTVYRVLADAVDDKRMINVYSTDGNEHFDGDTRRHYHLRCVKCGRIYDSHLQYNHELSKLGELAEPGFTILEHHVEFLCICPECSMVK